MSSSDETGSRLSSALDEVSSRATPTLPPKDGRASEPATDERAPAADWSVDDESDDLRSTGDEPKAVALPTIVPATSDRPATEEVPSVQTRSSAIPARVNPVGRSAPPAAPIPHQPVPATPAPSSAPTAAPASGQSAGPVTGWGDHMPGNAAVSPVPAARAGANLRAPGRKPRVRRVTRVLRHIDPWSTFKIALLFSLVAYLVALTSGVLLWRVADSTGTLDNVERWFTQFGWETFDFKGDEIFHNAWIIGLFGAVALTGGLVLLATLFNLVSDIVGGVRLTVLEEEVVERTVSSTRRYVVRRPPIGAEADTVPVATDWDIDEDDGPVATGKSDTVPVVTDWDIDEEDGPVATGEADTVPISESGPPAAGDSSDSPDTRPVGDWNVDD